MASTDLAASPEMSLRRLISSVVRKSVRQQFQRPSSCTEPSGTGGDEFASENRSSDAGYWGCEMSTDSFLELSSEVSPADVGSSTFRHGSKVGDGRHMTENGSLWKDEVRRKCSELTTCLEEYLRTGCYKKNGFYLKFPPELPERVAQKIVSVASAEPCGLRGCCVHLRLLHEDIASVLMSQREHDAGVVRRAEKCASWPESPANSEFDVPTLRPGFDFAKLPEMDATLTGNIRSDLSTDSGYCDLPDTRGGRRRLQHSFSSASVPVLPSLSAASRLHVACADIGRLDLYDSSSVPTFEIFVYLAPSTSWTWRVRKLFFSSLKLGNSNGPRMSDSPKARGTITVEADFTIVKKKLYRTHCNALEVLRCPPLSCR